MLLYWDHTVYYQNTSGNFFSKLNTSSVWRQTTDPRVAITKSCSIEMPPDVTANLPFAITGSLAGYTITPRLQYQNNGGAWQDLPESASITNATFSFMHPGVPTAASISVAVRDKTIITVTASASTSIVNAEESADGTSIRPGSTQAIVDSLGNFWGLSPDNKVTLNQVADNTTTQALILYYTNHVIYYQAVDQSWFKKPNILQQWKLTTSPYLNSPASDAVKIEAANQTITLLVAQLNQLLRRLQPNEVID
jgi:hypothetical protein